MRGPLIAKDRDDLPTERRKATQDVVSEQALEVGFLDDMLRTYFAGRELTLPDPTTDRLGIATCSSRGLGYGEHVL